jgi:uncharacterized iron-regulated membrane protein
MRQETVKKLYLVHSWVGAVTAILMFVITFTGAVAVFGAPELKIWSYPIIHHPVDIDPIELESLIRQHASEVEPEYRDNINVVFPAVHSKELLLIYFEAKVVGDEGRMHKRWVHFEHDPRNLELLNRREGTPGEIFKVFPTDMADFIIDFHAYLHLPHPWGLVLTGILGLVLFASIMTGLLIHRKILRELFTFRPFRSLRLLWTDTHKVIGVWGVLFHSTIAFTGVFLGFASVVLVPVAAYVSFQGDEQALVDSVLPKIEPQLTGEYSDINVAKVLSIVGEYGESNVGDVVSATILGGNDSNALVVLNTLAGDGVTAKVLQFHANTAVLEVSHTTYSRIGGISAPILDVMRPLHFGNFGGLPVKFLWAFLGLGTSLLALSGMMIWIERRAYGPSGKLSQKNYYRISRMSVSVCGGLLIATALLFYSQLFLDTADENLGFWFKAIFFFSWFVVGLFGLLNMNEYKLGRIILAVSGALFFFIAPLNGMVAGDHLLNVLEYGHYVTAGVDLVLMLSGAGILLLAYMLPNQRPDRKRSPEIVGQAEAVIGVV